MSTFTALSERIRPSEDVVFREMEGEAVLLNLDSGTYFGLNAVGTSIWKLLEENDSLQWVYEKMAEDYAVPDQVLQDDLLRLADQLREKGLVKKVS